jgi:hypothetical protein
MHAETPHESRRDRPAKKIAEGIFSMEVSRAYRTLFFHQEKYFQDLLQPADTHDS